MYLSTLFLFYVAILFCRISLADVDKQEYKNRVKQMFQHAYGSYMKYAFPADELMPLSCKGRYRGSEKSRGDIDDSLGNFTLTLVDTLDTIFILGDYENFEKAIINVMDISFDTDIEVSLFETNIRVLGGLLGGHTAALLVKNNKSNQILDWYTTELLDLAVILVDKMLPAFETETGIPYSRINLKYGVTERVKSETNTCTACAGTLILEFGSLSRYTNNPIYEAKAKKALFTIFDHRNRYSDLVGSVINIHTGNWIRPDSGVGAGVDSYYEYLLKAYILFGDETYLDKFKIHYNSIKKYMQDSENLAWPFVFLNVEMHRPLQKTRMFLDALLAFWPAMNVLLGDVIDGIEMHEMFHQVIKRHKFLPEAFTPDLKVYWAHHLLRPEFAESTYFLYLATKDPYYIEVAASIVDNIEKYSRVECGYAAIKDVKTLEKFDQMDSFFLAETFKYLYLIFSSEGDISIDLNDYIFTTEAHLLPISLSLINRPPEDRDSSTSWPKTFRPLEKCQNLYEMVARKNSLAKFNSSEKFNPDQNLDAYLYALLSNNQSNEDNLEYDLWQHNNRIRYPLKRFAHQVSPFFSGDETDNEFSSNDNFFVESKLPQINLLNDLGNIQLTNEAQMTSLRKMGITIKLSKDNKIELVHNPNMAESKISASQGLNLIQQLIKINDVSENDSNQIKKRHLTIMHMPYSSSISLQGWPSQFGKWPQEKLYLSPERDEKILSGNFIYGPLVIAEPIEACKDVEPIGFKSPLHGHFKNIRLQKYASNDRNSTNSLSLKNSIAVVLRGSCMFIEKARRLKDHGVLGMIVVDNADSGSITSLPPFSMSADKPEDLISNLDIPAIFLYNHEATKLLEYMSKMYNNNPSGSPSAFMGDKMNLSLLTMIGLLTHPVNQDTKYPVTFVSMHVSFQEIRDSDPTPRMRDMKLKGIRYEKADVGFRMRLFMPKGLVDTFFLREYSQLAIEFDRIMLPAPIDNQCFGMLKKLYQLSYEYYSEAHDPEYNNDHAVHIPKDWSLFFMKCVEFEFLDGSTSNHDTTSEIIIFYTFQDLPHDSNIPDILNNTLRVASQSFDL